MGDGASWCVCVWTIQSVSVFDKLARSAHFRANNGAGGMISSSIWEVPDLPIVSDDSPDVEPAVCCLDKWLLLPVCFLSTFVFLLDGTGFCTVCVFHFFFRDNSLSEDCLVAKGSVSLGCQPNCRLCGCVCVANFFHPVVMPMRKSPGREVEFETGCCDTE